MNEPELPYRERLLLIRNGLAEKTTGKKPPKPLRKISLKKMAEDKANKNAGNDSELDLFFEEMLKRCTGRCLFCNGKTTAVSADFWRDDNPIWSQEANDKKHERTIEVMRRISISHLLPKRPIDKGGFPSVATNENNWIELCWQCHNSFDSGKISWLTIKDSKEWDIIKEKLLNVLPMVASEERKNKLYSLLNDLVYANEN